jgi:uncharacterized protein (DUF305 family)
MLNRRDHSRLQIALPWIAAAAALLFAALLVLAQPQARIGARFTASAPAVPGPIDIGFAQSMSLHHQQAIAMAQLMLDGRPTP